MERPDDAPPPPYSETDIYSTSTLSAIHPSPPDQTADDASVAASSSHSNIIYTPPETPDAHHGWAAAGGTDDSSPASAQAYFAARPAAGRPPSAHIVPATHSAEGMTPADLPHPSWSADRPAAEQDRHTFATHLLPGHAEKTNEHLVDREPSAEREATPSEPGRGHGRGRDRYARGPHREGRANRSHSRSSASSASSSSASGSDSSVGSLPDWDELSDPQLPVVRNSVLSWIHSDQPVSKAEYKRVRAEIKAAEGTPVSRQAGSAGQRKEIKQLLAQWKEVKKSQKTTKKKAKKAAKKEKKTRKWERKAERKETKRNRRDHQYSEQETRRDAPAAGSHAYDVFGSAPPDPHGQSSAFGPASGRAGPWHPGRGAFGVGPGRGGDRGRFGGRGGWGHGGWDRGGWGRGAFGGPWFHPPGAWPASGSSEKAALDSAQQAREGASATAAAAVRHAHAVRDAALDHARRQGAEATTRAHAARDAALRDAEASRRGARETADRAREEAAEATTRAHAARDAALRNAEASRQGAREAADRARAEAMRHASPWQPWERWQGAAATGAGPSSPQEKREILAAQASQGDENMAGPARQDRERLGTEIHELENRLQAMRMEADEALAKQLAEEETRGGPSS